MRRTVRGVAVMAVALGAGASTGRADMDKHTRQQALRSVVWIGDVQCGGDGDCDVVASGSGTVLTADGLILTNNHVVQDVDGDGAPLFTALRIGVLHDYDQPPEVLCLADPRHAIRDRALDLALIKCEVDTDMRPLAKGAVVFPAAARIGDSKSLAPGDDVAVIGYPGVGGGTITYTTGKISGFTSDEDLQNAGAQEGEGTQRDWIKTDAKIAPGNSGGGAFAADGSLIGVPSANWSQPQEGVQFTMGLIRPIERAKPLLDKVGDFEPASVVDSSDENWQTGGKGAAAVAHAAPRTLKRTGGVRVVGKLVSSDTGVPIAGGIVLILKPGVRVRQINKDNIQTLYLAKASSGAGGGFSLDKELTPGRYAVVVMADGYQPIAVDRALEIDGSTPSVDDVGEIELEASDTN